MILKIKTLKIYIETLSYITLFELLSKIHKKVCFFFTYFSENNTLIHTVDFVLVRYSTTLQSCYLAVWGHLIVPAFHNLFVDGI